MEADWPALARDMSDRHFGAGGDGIILVLPSRVAHLRMRMFNADGSEGEMCGNGIRCFAKYAIERDIARPDGLGTAGRDPSRDTDRGSGGGQRAGCGGQGSHGEPRPRPR